MNGRVVYRQQFTRCGKARCRKCKEGEGHGPYWYAYWNENGRTKTRYIGVRLPAGLDAQQGHSEGEAAHARPTPIVRVSLLGQFRVEHRDGDEWRIVNPQAWQHRRVRSLLGCLLSSPGRRLSREQAMRLLWPDLEKEIAANRLNGAVHELRNILEPGLERPADSRLLRLEHDVLELADHLLLWVDAEAFEQLLQQANTLSDTQQGEQLLEEARDLYKGSYLLEELYSEWASRRRDSLQEQWIALLLKLAKLRAARGALLEAIEALDALRAADSTNENALQLLMVYLAQLHRRAEALRIYRQHASMLKREYESEPLPETRSLYLLLRQGRIPEEYTPRRNAINDAARQPDRGAIDCDDETVSEQDGTGGHVAGRNQLRPYARPTWQPHPHRYALVGRERELEEMRRILSTITDHTTRPDVPHFLGLSGSPGVGKTRLAEELSHEAEARGWAVVWNSDGKTKQHLLQLALEKLAAGMTQPGEQTPSSPAKPSPVLTGRREHMHLWESAQEIFFTVSQVYPLLLVLDDLQWEDEENINLLGYLLNHCHEQRILIVGTWRESELASSPALSALLRDLQRKQALVLLQVGPLADSAIASMLAHLPQDIARRIQQQAAGNPFFAEGLARQAEQNAEQAPADIAAVFEQQLLKVSADCRTLLAQAAQRTEMGETFEFQQLLTQEQMEDALLDLLEEALQAKLLYEEEAGSGITSITYHFWHPLLIRYLRGGFTVRH